MNLFKATFLVLITIVIHVSVDAQDWVSYESQQKINDLVDTGNELLMATDAGLVVMNKTTLDKSLFNTSNSNLPFNHIESITKGLSGNTWIGTYDLRLAQFDGNDFQDVTVPTGNFNPLTVILYDLKEAPNGDLWIGTNQGVFHRQGLTWNQYTQTEIGADFGWAWDIEINNAGEVFIASNYIHKFSNGVWSNISNNTDLSAYLHADLFFSSNGDMYFIGDLDKIGRYDGVAWQEYDNTGLNGSEIIRFTEDTNGDLYFSSRNDGVFKLVNNVWTLQVDAQTQAFNNETTYFYIDEQNRRWLNNRIYLSVNDNGNIQSTLITEHTIETNGIGNISKGDNGDMFFMTNIGSVATIDPNGNWSFFSLPSTLVQFENPNDILYQTANDIWMTTDNGLYHYDGTDWTFDNLGVCKEIAVDSQGKIYLLATGKIYIIDNGTMTEYNTNNSLLSTLILSSFGVDMNDNLWISSFDWNGNNLIQKVSSTGTWTNYEGTDHPEIDQPRGNFHFDINGNVWLPINGVGAIVFDGTTWTNPFIGNLNEMVNYNAFAVESDPTGKIYFSHQYGVTTLLNGEWEDLLITDVPNTNSSHGAVIKFDDNGTLWWASSRYGVFSYTPDTSTPIFNHQALDTHFDIFPNPASDYTVLDFEIEKESEVNALIYNNLGQLISNKDLGRLNPGNYQETINVEHLSKGFYTLLLQINEKSSARKLIVK